MENINIEVPKALIPALENGSFNGEVLLYLKNSKVVDGFLLKRNEFVTSVEDFIQASLLAGINIHQSDIISKQG